MADGVVPSQAGMVLQPQGLRLPWLRETNSRLGTRPVSPLGSPWFLRLRGHVGRLGLGGRGGGGGCGCRSATAGGEAFGAADGAVGVMDFHHCAA